MFVGILKKYIHHILVVAILLIGTEAYSQYRGRKSFSQGLSVSLLAGPNVSAMDISESGVIGANYGIAFDKMLSSAWAIDLSLLKGNLGAERWMEDESPNNGLYFETDYTEVSLGLVADLTSLVNGYYRYRPVSVKLLGGLGVIAYDEMAYKENGDVDDLHIDEHGKGTELFLKTGGIINYRLDPKWNFKVQGTVNYIMGDRVDGYEHGAFDYANSAGDPKMTDNNDVYASFLFGIEYTFDFAPFRSSPKFNRKNYARKYKNRYPKRSSHKRRRRY